MRVPPSLMMQCIRALLVICLEPDPPGFGALGWRVRQWYSFRTLLGFCASVDGLRWSLWLLAWQLAAMNLAWHFDLPLRAQAWFMWSAALWALPWLLFVRRRMLARLLRETEPDRS